MSWEYRPAFDAADRAALQSGKHLVFVCPPAAWAVLPLLRAIPTPDEAGTDTLVLVPDITDAVEFGDVLNDVTELRPALAVTGLARAQRLLSAQAVRTLLATPIDALELVKRAALKTDRLRQVVVGWPHQHHLPEQSEALDLLLAESREAGRLVATIDPAGDASFIERHARRAPVAVGGRLPGAPGAGVRFAVTDGERLGRTVRALLDALNPPSSLVWTPTADATLSRALAGDPTVTTSTTDPDQPVELVIAARLPSAEALEALRANAREVVVVVRATQVGYLERLAQPLKAIPLPSEADRARDTAFRLRARLRERLAGGGASADLVALAPLFDEYDPALIAAAAVQNLTAEPAAPSERPQDAPAWVIVRLSVGKRDRLRPADVVGTLLNVAGLAKDDVGLVDIRESFTLVYVRAEAAERARQGLEGHMLRGRPIAARLDRR